MQVEFPRLKIEDAGEYVELLMENCYYIPNPGHPRLPIKSIVFKLPIYSSVSTVNVVIKDTSSTTLSKQILPAPNPVPIYANELTDQFQSIPSTGSIRTNYSIYDYNELYPTNWF